jgi:signal transduction histidine kinase
MKIRALGDQISRTAVRRYGFAVAIFLVIIAIASVVSVTGLKINLTVPVIAGLFIVAWFAGRWPGLALAVMMQGTTIAFSTIAPEMAMWRVVIGHLSVFALLVFLVLIISSRRSADDQLRKQRDEMAELNASLEKRVAQRTAELIESEARYHTLFNSIDEGFCIIEMIFDKDDKPVDYRFLEINPAFEKQSGLTDALGKRILELIGSLEEHWFETFGRVAMTGEAVRFRNHADQLNRSYDVYGCRFGAPENRQVAVVFRDITEQVIAEANIVELNNKLGQRAAQLEAVNRELEAFSYSVSHDLRAPLRHINGFSQALVEDYYGKLDETGKGYLQAMRDATREMGQLIDDLLELARVTRSEMHQQPVDLGELAAGILAKMQKRSPERKVRVNIQKGLVAIGDKPLLEIALINLLGNAWKFTAKQEDAEIVFGQARSNGHADYFVRDNGAGFDMDYVDKLFGAFQRLHSMSEFEGTGIGLATVQRIVRRHGGRVWAEGAVNQGATFYFTLQEDTEVGNGEQNDPTGRG